MCRETSQTSGQGKFPVGRKGVPGMFGGQALQLGGVWLPAPLPVCHQGAGAGPGLLWLPSLNTVKT